MAPEFAIFAGNASRKLGDAVARNLDVRIGAAAIERFPDAEISVEIQEPIRRKQVFFIQSTAPPVNDHLMELLAFADAARRASAAQIVAVIPYFGYSRSDRRRGKREPISARLVADLLEAAGIQHVITLDLHACQIEGFFHIPVDSRSAVPVLCDAVRPHLPPETVVVSPDSGGLKLATDYARRLGTSVVLLHKARESGTETHVTHLVGDVRGRACLIVDDMISTGGTITGGIDVLLDAGARPGIFIAATHGVLLEGARDKLMGKPVANLFVTDTIEHVMDEPPSLRVISIASLLADAIRHALTEGRPSSRA